MPSSFCFSKVVKSCEDNPLLGTESSLALKAADNPDMFEILKLSNEVY